MWELVRHVSFGVPSQPCRIRNSGQVRAVHLNRPPDDSSANEGLSTAAGRHGANQQLASVQEAQVAGALNRPVIVALGRCGQNTHPLQRTAAPPPSLTSPVTKYLPSGEKARAVMVFLQRDEAGSEGHWHPGRSLTPSQSLQKARPADTHGTCGTSLSGSGAPPGPSRQSHRDHRRCPPPREAGDSWGSRPIYLELLRM